MSLPVGVVGHSIPELHIQRIEKPVAVNGGGTVWLGRHGWYVSAATTSVCEIYVGSETDARRCLAGVAQALREGR